MALQQGCAAARHSAAAPPGVADTAFGVPSSGAATFVYVRACVLFFCNIERAREGAQMENTDGLIEINGVEA